MTPESPNRASWSFMGVSPINRNSQKKAALDLGVDAAHLSGMSIASPSKTFVKSNSACANWLLAASQVHKAKYEQITDSKGRGADEWKECRRESCRWMFYCSIAGIGTAMWADYILFFDHQEPSSRYTCSSKIGSFPPCPQIGRIQRSNNVKAPPHIHARAVSRPPALRRSLSLQFCTAVTTGAALYFLIW